MYGKNATCYIRPGSGPILIRIESNAGHGGSTGTSPVSKVIEEWADKIGFAAHFMPAGALSAPRAGPGHPRSPSAAERAHEEHGRREPLGPRLRERDLARELRPLAVDHLDVAHEPGLVAHNREVGRAL